MSNAQLALAEKSLVINKDLSSQKLNVTKDFHKIILPCRMIVAGPTLSGKSEFILKLIKYRQTVFNGEFTRILYCIPPQSTSLHYGYIQRMTKYFKNLHVIEGLPKLVRDGLTDEGDGAKLLIVDDQVDEMMRSDEMRRVFTIHSHHCNLSISKFYKNG